MGPGLERSVQRSHRYETGVTMKNIPMLAAFTVLAFDAMIRDLPISGQLSLALRPNSLLRRSSSAQRRNCYSTATGQKAERTLRSASRSPRCADCVDDSYRGPNAGFDIEL